MSDIADIMEVFKRDDEPFELLFVDENEDPIDITTWLIKFSVKQAGQDEILISKSSDNVTEINKTDPTNGIAILYIISSDTADLDPGTYEFDIQYTISTNVRTYQKGVFVVKGDVTP